MSTTQVHVFISHSWSHSEHYDTLADWIFQRPWRSGSTSLDFRDYSVPRDDPIHDAPTAEAVGRGERKDLYLPFTDIEPMIPRVFGACCISRSF